MIPENLQQTVDLFASLCKSDPRIVAAFVGGSLATGTADQYSDLDLYLITTDEEYDSFFAERVAFLRQLGEPVFLEDYDGHGFDMLLFIFEDAVKGELALARASHFLHIHDGHYRVLVDKVGLLRGMTFSIERIPAEAQRHVLEGLIKSFWRYLYLLTGALGRGRLLTAAGYFEGMRRPLLQVCRLSVDFADGGGHPPPETLLPEQMVAAVARTFPHLQREEMTVAAQEAVRLFREVAKPLAQAQGVAYPEPLERVVLKWFARVADLDASGSS